MTNVHASAVLLGESARSFGGRADDGVLILGDSNAGKSTLALALIGRGATLVADDRTELFARADVLWARAPKTLAGLIEVRGVGIVELAYAVEARVALAVRLAPMRDVSRLPEPQEYAPPEEIALRKRPPLIVLPHDDPALADRVLLAASAFANALFRTESNSL